MEESTEKSKAEQKRFFNWLLRLQQYAVEEARRRKRMHEVKVGDRVYAPFYGYGTVTVIRNGCMYPIIVTWDEGEHKNTDFTRDGDALMHAPDPRFKITLVDTDLKKIDERRNSRMEERTKNVEEDKIKTDNAVNPSHYQVAGIPEAIEIMEHLMTKEQLDGFLWGNIIKYAYRYGRKGDKAETAGKIAWYSQKLKEIEECESK